MESSHIGGLRVCCWIEQWGASLLHRLCSVEWKFILQVGIASLEGNKIYTGFGIRQNYVAVLFTPKQWWIYPQAEQPGAQGVIFQGLQIWDQFFLCLTEIYIAKCYQVHTNNQRVICVLIADNLLHVQINEEITN